jgi:hypothetical protein|tara:strand:+ start:2419 stop:2565 length:147 start_codon:yes stop_codon:yes gene_type:complete
MTDKSNASVKPEKISKDQAEKLNDFAQGLDDEITHSVDYGNLEEDKNA